MTCPLSSLIYRPSSALTGILAALTAPLREAKVPIFGEQALPQL